MKASQSWEQGGDLSRKGYTVHLQNIIITLYLYLYLYLCLYAICLHISIIIIDIVNVGCAPFTYDPFTYCPFYLPVVGKRVGFHHHLSSMCQNHPKGPSDLQCSQKSILGHFRLILPFLDLWEGFCLFGPH